MGKGEPCQAQQHELGYSTGLLDASRGLLPQYLQDSYLRGYLKGIKTLPVDSEGRVQYPSPRQQFAFGHVDCAEQFFEA